MSQPTHLTLRQMLEGMTLVFDPAAAGELDAAIQFDVTGPEPGSYYLRVAHGDCTFHLGDASDPTLTISTPSDVWLRVSQGQLDGQEALIQGLYQANGDLSLLMQMGTLFNSENGVDDVSAYAAAPDQRPAGPLPLPGMAWLTVAFVPWMAMWITFDIPSISRWFSVGLPFVLALSIVGYRLAFDRPTWMEWGGLGFFTLAGLLTLVGNPAFALLGSVIGSIVMASLWLSSLVFQEMPLCGEYSKWGYIKPLWRTSLFIHPNAVISLMWGWQFLVASLFGIGAGLLPEIWVILTVIRYLLLVPAFMFTSVYQKGAATRPIADVEQAMARIRYGAILGMVAAVAMIVATWLWL